MKKFIFILIATLLSLNSFSQKERVNYLTTFDDKFLHFGFILGFNLLDFGIENYQTLGDNPNLELNGSFSFRDKSYDPVTKDSRIYTDVAQLVPGFTVGIVTSLRLSKSFNLRFLPGMSFGERKLYYNIPIEDIYNINNRYYSVKSTFLDFPLNIKYKAHRINNDRPYVLFGVAFRYDLSNTAEEDLVKLRRRGYYVELGAGWDHFFDYFKFAGEAKMSFGLSNQLGDLPHEKGQSKFYAQSIKDLRSIIFTMSFYFE